MHSPRYASTITFPNGVDHIDEELEASWADPAWQVDSTSHACCAGIGDHTAECTVHAELAAVPAPADAHHVEGWRDEFGTGEFDRYFCGTRRSAACVTLSVTGFQAADGTARRDVHIFAADVHLDRTAPRTLDLTYPDGSMRPNSYTVETFVDEQLEKPTRSSTESPLHA